jgi:hypothetical protein
MQLKREKSGYYNKRNDTHANNNKYSETSKTYSADKDDSTTTKADFVNTEDSVNVNQNSGETNKGCSSCLGKIIEWIIYIVIIYFVINHFHLVDRAKNLLNNVSSLQYSTEEESSEKESVDEVKNLKAEEVVEYYFKYIKEGEDEKADKLFSSEADENFQALTVAEYNQTITDLYYGFEEDIPTYPLFEEIRNVAYVINSVNIDETEEYAEVDVEVENCDVALMFGLILEADTNENILETLSDSQLQKLFRNAIKEYEDICMINTNATFVLKKNQEGIWKIDSISPLKDFSTVMIGQADDLVLTLNGEDVEDDSDNYEEGDVEYDEDEEYDDAGSDLLW